MSPTSRTGSVRGPIDRSDGSTGWLIRWFGSDGVRRSETVTGDKRDAFRRLQRRLTEAEEERSGLRVAKAAPPPTLTQVTHRVADEVLPTRQRPRQQLRTLTIIAQWWEPTFGTQPIDAITAAGVRATVAQMRQAGRAAATCNRVVAALSVVMEAAIEWGYRSDNPCRAHGIHQREGRKVPRYLSPEEAGRLLAAARGRWRRFFALALYTGARLGELSALTWGDLDLTGGVIHIRRSHDGDPKSGHQRTIPLHPDLVPYLGDPGPSDHLVCQGAPRRRSAPDPTRDRIVSPTRALWSTLEAAGIDRRIGVHCLRHTFATAWIAAGGNARQLQAVLGHSTPAMTGRYAHVVGDGVEDIRRINLAVPARDDDKDHSDE